MTDAGKPSRKGPDWLSKTLAGTLLGLALALACSGLLNLALQPMPLPTRGQLAMWSVAPVWLGVAGAVYVIASGWRAWLWLGLANGLCWGLLLALQKAVT